MKKKFVSTIEDLIIALNKDKNSLDITVVLTSGEFRTFSLKLKHINKLISEL